MKQDAATFYQSKASWRTPEPTSACVCHCPGVVTVLGWSDDGHLALGEGEEPLKMCVGGNGQTSLKLKIESEAARVAGGCLWVLHLGIVLFSPSSNGFVYSASVCILQWSCSAHAWVFLKWNLTGRCVSAAHGCSGSSNLPETGTEWGFFFFFSTNCFALHIPLLLCCWTCQTTSTLTSFSLYEEAGVVSIRNEQKGV